MSNFDPKQLTRTHRLTFEGDWPVSVAFVDDDRVAAGNRRGDLFVWDLTAEPAPEAEDKDDKKGDEAAAPNVWPTHRLEGHGNMVGPGLANIGKRHDRKYLLEAIVFPSKRDPKRLLAAWTQHLAFLHLPLSQPAKETRFLFFDEPNKLYKYSPVAQPTETLSALVDLYLLGQAQPPLLFPEIAHAAIKRNWPPPDDLPRDAWEDAMLQTAQQEFAKNIHSGYSGGGPSFWDEYKQAIWPEPPALGDEFVRQSIAAFVPLLSSLSQERFDPETANA